MGGSARKTRVKSVLSSILLAFSLILGNIAGFFPTTSYAHAEVLPSWARFAGFNDSNATWYSSTSTLQLMENVDLDRPLLLNSGSLDLTIDLNGKTISKGDSFSESQMIYISSADINVTISGNGTIDGNHLVQPFDISNGTLILESGTIKNGTSSGTGGGVSVRGNGKFIMNGGIIQNCHSDYQGGGVSVKTGSTFIMNGGTIENNDAGGLSGGAGVLVEGSFTMFGGTINNEVFVNNTGTFLKTSGATANNINGTVTDACAVSFNANGGSGSMLPQAVQQNTSTALSACTFTRNDGTFAGWSTTANGNVIQYAEGANVNTDSDLTLYALWNLTYTVTFKVVNGAWDNGATADQTVTLSRPYDEDLALVLAANQIPAVGNAPGNGYTAGSWDVAPSTATVINEDKIYTYTYTGSGNNGNNNGNNNDNGGNGNNNNHGSGSSSGNSSHSDTHVHSYSWVITSEPTAYENGEMVYQCSCGHIAARADIEASSKLVTDGIRSFSATAQGGTVKLDFGYYFSINKAFALAHDARADVTTIITYYYQGKHYEMTIPAGFNLLQTIDEKGWAGFRYIGSFPGIITKEIP